MFCCIVLESKGMPDMAWNILQLNVKLIEHSSSVWTVVNPQLRICWPLSVQEGEWDNSLFSHTECVFYYDQANSVWKEKYVSASAVDDNVGSSLDVGTPTVHLPAFTASHANSCHFCWCCYTDTSADRPNYVPGSDWRIYLFLSSVYPWLLDTVRLPLAK